MANKTANTARDRLIAVLREKADELGHSPRVKDFPSGSRPSYMTFIREFGSWSAAQEAAGLESRGRGRPREEF